MSNLGLPAAAHPPVPRTRTSSGRLQAGLSALVLLLASGASIAPALAQEEHVAWRFRMEAPYCQHRQAVAPDGTVYVQDVRGTLHALSHEGTLLWQYDAGNYPNGQGGEGPVVRHPDGTIIVTGDPLGPDVEIHAVSPDGSPRWVFTDTNTIGVIAGPAIGPDGNVYVVTDLEGLGLICLSIEGELLWSNPGNPAFHEHGAAGEEIAFGPSSPGGPVDQLYVAFDERAIALEQIFGFSLDGEQQFNTPTGGLSDPLGQRQGQPVTGPDGTVYLCALAMGVGWRLQAFDPSDGHREWLYFPTGTNVLSEPDVGPDGTIFVTRNLGQIHAVHPAPSERWVYTSTEVHFGPIASPANDVVLAGGIITYGAPGFVKALDLEDGSLLWRIDLPSEGGFDMIPFTRPTFAAGGARAYITTTLPGQPQGEAYCYLYAIDVTPQNPVSVLPAISLAEIGASPNPSANGFNLSFQVSRPGPIDARVFDPAGRLVRILTAEAPAAGGHALHWDGRDSSGRDVGSGVFYARLSGGGEQGTVKLVRARP